MRGRGWAGTRKDGFGATKPYGESSFGGSELGGDTMTTNRVQDHLDACFDVKEEITCRWQDAFENTRWG
jgi:hypothetical protein